MDLTEHLKPQGVISMMTAQMIRIMVLALAAVHVSKSVKVDESECMCIIYFL